MSGQNNPARLLPVRPDLDQLKHQAKDLLRNIRRGDPEALAEFNQFHPGETKGEIKLADAQFALARSYGAASWPRLVQSCKLIDAIWRDDLEAVRELVVKHPNLLHENAGIRNNNWGPPLSYAANLGRDRIIKMLYDLGARDLATAMAPFTRLLLDHDANPNVRASLRKQLHPGYGPKYDVETTYEYRDVTPLGWGRHFHAKVFVSEPAMQLIEERGGVE